MVLKLLISNLSIVIKLIVIEEICTPEPISAVTFSPLTNTSDSFGSPVSLKVGLDYDRGLLQTGLFKISLFVFGWFWANFYYSWRDLGPTPLPPIEVSLRWTLSPSMSPKPTVITLNRLSILFGWTCCWSPQSFSFQWSIRGGFTPPLSTWLQNWMTLG